jgi:PAS domain S-box-containing protein
MTGENAGAPGTSVALGGQDTPLDAIIEHVADGIVIVAMDGSVRFANPAAEQLFGRSKSDLIGVDFGFPIVEEGSAEIDIIRPGATALVAELRMVEMEWKGEPAILISLRDITDRREAEERGRDLVAAESARRLAEQEKSRFRFLAEASSVLDSSLEYQEVLEALARLIVEPRAAAQGTDEQAEVALADWCMIDVVEPDGSIDCVATSHQNADGEELLRELCERFPPGWDERFPAARAFRDRQTTFLAELDEPTLASLTRGPEHATLLRRVGAGSLLAIPLVARGETVGAMTLGRIRRRYAENDLAMAQDLAQRASFALANARLYQAANEANRAKSDFLAVMSHELRTPLNAVMGYTDLLNAEVTGPLNDRQKEQLDRISLSSRHLLSIVDEILSYARLEAGREELHLEPIDLDTLFEEVRGIMEAEVQQKGLRLVINGSNGTGILHTDRTRLRQILLNLLSNAVKFTDEGEIELEAAEDGAAHHIMVRDSGIGIPAESLPQIFEPFWQVEQSTSRRVGGTGLGLSVASRMARLLGGSLHVESAVGKGSCFTLFLPIGGSTVGE